MPVLAADHLTGTGTLVLAGVTLGLVVVTGALARFTKHLVGEARTTRYEMEESRLLTIRPLLAFDVMVLGGRIGELFIKNVGQGPAFDVRLSILFEHQRGPDRREWREFTMVPGESHELHLPDLFHRDMRTCESESLAVSISGSMRDSEDLIIDIEESLDVSEWWNTNVAADERILGRRKIPESPTGTTQSRWPSAAEESDENA